MNKWVTEELVLEFIRENTDIDLNTYRILFEKDKDGEIQCCAMYMLGNAYFKDFEFGGEWFEGIVFKSSSGNMVKVTEPSQSKWREFMAKKFGQQYIDDYSEFMWKYFEEKHKRFNEEIESFNSEMIILENL